jgi:hypothetical protein
MVLTRPIFVSPPCSHRLEDGGEQESVIGVVLIRQMRALNDRGAPRKPTTASTPAMASLIAFSSAKEPLVTRAAGFKNVLAESSDHERT